VLKRLGRVKRRDGADGLLKKKIKRVGEEKRPTTKRKKKYGTSNQKKENAKKIGFDYFWAWKKLG